MSTKSVRTASYGFASLLALSTSCAAADLGSGPPPVYDEPRYGASRPAIWTGFYMGAYGGYSAAHDFTRDVSVTPYDNGVYDRFRSRDSGFTGGGTLGYNYQIGSFVLGLESDLGYAAISKATFARNVGSGPDVSAGIDGGLVGTVRPRVGYAFGNLLVYGTAGLAFGNFTTSITDGCAVAPCNGNTISASKDSTRLGLAVGAGVEYMLGQHWTTKLEWMHTDYGGITTSGLGADGNPYSWRSNISENALRLGINYKF